MADATGAPVPTGTSPFDVPGDLKDLADHFGDEEFYSVASASNLPASGNWRGRVLMARDTGVLYVCTALPGTWKTVTSTDDSGWIVVGSGGGAPAFGTGWSAVSASGWSGVRFRLKNGVLFISGAATKSSYSGLGDAIFTLPSGFRPSTRFIGVGYGSTGAQYVVVEATGVVTPVLAGTSQFNFSATVPVG